MSSIRIELETDLLDLKGLLLAMKYTLSDQYGEVEGDQRNRHDTLKTLLAYALGLRDEIEETVAKLSYADPVPCQSQTNETKED